MDAFYGDPDKENDGLPDAFFESNYLVRVVAPFQMYYAGKPTSGIRIHRKCAESLSRVLLQISKEFTPAEIARYGLNTTGGGYNFRLKRGGSTPSIHSWGAAVDLAPDLNRFGWEYLSRPNMMPQKVVKAFALEGWTWGGMWRTPDGMHFQAANI